MARQAMLRFLETAFRRWWVFCLPLVAMALLAVVSLQGQERKFESTAVIRADKGGLLAEQDDQGGFTFDTPADIASRQIGESLRTDEFVRSVIERSGIDPGVVPRLSNVRDFRRAMSVFPDGENLVKVKATSADPEASRRLAESTIDAYVATVVENVVTESKTAIDFWTQQLGPYAKDVERAQLAYNQFVIQFPDPIGDVERPADEALQLQRLTDDLTAAEDKYSQTTDKIEDAQLRSRQAEAAVGERLKVVDPPEAATAPLSTRKDSVITVGLYAFVGVLLSLAITALLTFLDRSLHTAADVKARLGDGVDVLAEVPDTKARHDPAGQGKAQPAQPADERKEAPV